VRDRVGIFDLDTRMVARYLTPEVDLSPIFEVARMSPRLSVHFNGPGNGEDDCRAFMDGAIAACRRSGWMDILIIEKIYKLRMDVQDHNMIISKLLEKHEDPGNEVEGDALLSRLGLTAVGWWIGSVDRHLTPDQSKISSHIKGLYQHQTNLRPHRPVPRTILDEPVSFMSPDMC
jgi:hypothetical protein